MTATLVTDDAVWDGIGTLSIGVLLAVIAVVLAIEMKSLLIGETAEPRGGGTRSAPPSRATPPSTGSSTCAPSTSGPDELLVGAKVSFRDDLAVGELADAVNRVEAVVRSSVPEARVMYIEPDVLRTDQAVR